jgi:hypothetical protein
MVPRLGFLTIHLLMVSVVTALLTLSSNKETLFLLFIAVGFIFALCLVNEGCLLSRLEGKVPLLDQEANKFVLAALGLHAEDITLGNLEKILIGFTLFFIGAKLLFIWGIESVYGRPYSALMCKVASGRSGVWAKILA